MQPWWTENVVAGMSLVVFHLIARISSNFEADGQFGKLGFATSRPLRSSSHCCCCCCCCCKSNVLHHLTFWSKLLVLWPFVVEAAAVESRWSTRSNKNLNEQTLERKNKETYLKLKTTKNVVMKDMNYLRWKNQLIYPHEHAQSIHYYRLLTWKV